METAAFEFVEMTFVALQKHLRCILINILRKRRYRGSKMFALNTQCVICFPVIIARTSMRTFGIG